MTRRCLLVIATLISLANIALSEGAFQRTRNGKALVWNNHPKPGDEATWSGGRDRDGYARGFGTLIWYTKVPDSTKPAVYARYWGNMVGGKFSGAVNVHSKKKTHYAIFADGVRMTGWAPGRAPSRITNPRFADAMKKAAAASRTEKFEPERQLTNVPQIEPAPPAAGPGPIGTSNRPIESPAMPDQESDISPRTGQIDIDDSLRLLAWPPRSLRRK